MDPDNPVVKLCAEGMQAEREGRFGDAAALFQRAWDRSVDDCEACIAAHYVARHQTTDRDTLRWNEIALDRADRVADDRVRQFYPSLYLNLGRSHESLGDLDRARRYYELAAACLVVLPPGPYAEIVRAGLEGARQRLGS